MTSTRDVCRRAGIGLLVLCTVWLVIENGVLLALLTWTQLRPAAHPLWLFGIATLAAAPFAWLAALVTFAFGARRMHRMHHMHRAGAWPMCPKEAPHA